MPINNPNWATNIGRKLIDYYNIIDETAGKADDWLESKIPGLGRELRDFNQASLPINPAGWEGNLMETGAKYAPMAAALFTNPATTKKMTAAIRNAIIGRYGGGTLDDIVGLYRNVIKARYPRLSRYIKIEPDYNSAGGGVHTFRATKLFAEAGQLPSEEAAAELGLAKFVNPAKGYEGSYTPEKGKGHILRRALRNLRTITDEINIGSQDFPEEMSHNQKVIMDFSPGTTEHELGHMASAWKGNYQAGPQYQPFRQMLKDNPHLYRNQVIYKYSRQPEEAYANSAGRTILESLDNYARRVGFDSWYDLYNRTKNLQYQDLWNGSADPLLKIFNIR